MDKESIFVITTLKYGYDNTRTVGWYNFLENAITAVENNFGDIHEGSNWYCVIEEIKPGIYSCPPVSEVWFKWIKIQERYVECPKPDHLKRICSFGIG